jgi:hypothetical protein
MSNSDYATMLTFLHSAISNAYDIANHLRHNAPAEDPELANEVEEVFGYLANAHEISELIRP